MLASLLLPLLASTALQAEQQEPTLVVYHHAAIEFSLPTEYKGYTKELIDEITQKDFIAIDDPEGRFTVLVDNRAYPIKSLESAAGIFNEAAKAGLTGFDTSTELGQKATALVRGYDPCIDFSKPLQQPIIGVSIELYVRPAGASKWGSLPLEDRSQRGYMEKRTPELEAKMRAGEMPPAKGPVLYLSQELIRPYTTRVFMSNPKFDNYAANEMIKDASKLVSDRFESALESYRHGSDSFITSLLSKFLGNLANRLPGELKLSDLPEDVRNNLVANMQMNPSQYGFDSENTLGEFLANGGTFEFQPRLCLGVSSYDSTNDNGTIRRKGVSVVLPFPTKPKR